MPPVIGLCHLALNVADVARAEAFYVGVLGFAVEWRPDPENVYLRLGADNLAIHRAAAPDEPAFAQNRGQRLAHLGIVVPRPDDVDAWADHLRRHGTAILAEPRTHRDGARSLYTADPEGNVVQILYHPPISDAR
jgi:catechol 2,3-dioxygenase-like lactoylglutathione lyase family enzyme